MYGVYCYMYIYVYVSVCVCNSPNQVKNKYYTVLWLFLRRLGKVSLKKMLSPHLKNCAIDIFLGVRGGVGSNKFCRQRLPNHPPPPPPVCFLQFKP